MKSLQPIRELLAWLPLAWLPLVCVFLALVLPGCDHGGTSPSGSEDEQPGDASTQDSDAANPDVTDAPDELTLLDEAPWSDERIAEEVAACEAWHAAQSPPDVEVDQVDCSSGDCSVDVLLPNADRVPVEVTVTWDKLPVPDVPCDCDLGTLEFRGLSGEVQAQVSFDGKALRHEVWLPRDLPMDAVLIGDSAGEVLPAGELILEQGLVIREQRRLFYAASTDDDVILFSGHVEVSGPEPEELPELGMALSRDAAYPQVFGRDLTTDGDFEFQVFKGTYDVWLAAGTMHHSGQYRGASGYRPISNGLQLNLDRTLNETVELVHLRIAGVSYSSELITDAGVSIPFSASESGHWIWPGEYSLIHRQNEVGFVGETVTSNREIDTDSDRYLIETPIETPDGTAWFSLREDDLGYSIFKPRARFTLAGGEVADVRSNILIEPFRLEVPPAEMTLLYPWEGRQVSGVRMRPKMEVTGSALVDPMVYEHAVPVRFESGGDLRQGARLEKNWGSAVERIEFDGSLSSEFLIPPGVFDVVYRANGSGTLSKRCQPFMGTRLVNLPVEGRNVMLQAVDRAGVLWPGVDFEVVNLSNGLSAEFAAAGPDSSGTSVILQPGHYEVRAELRTPGFNRDLWGWGATIIEVK